MRSISATTTFSTRLSDHVAHFGLEHHESNDSRVGERCLVDPELRLLAPACCRMNMCTPGMESIGVPRAWPRPDYQKPMQTTCSGFMKVSRRIWEMCSADAAALRTPEQFRDNLALIAASLDHRPGRTWRNLQDTADGVPCMQGCARTSGTSWRRTLDYYDEDVLNWLWVDTIIRQQSKEQKSIDDFCHLFHGAPSGAPGVKTYTFDDVVNTLNQVVAYDWRGFWTERLTNHGPGAPLGWN